jgi:flagellar hook-associated protein FlgK
LELEKIVHVPTGSLFHSIGIQHIHYELNTEQTTLPHVYPPNENEDKNGNHNSNSPHLFLLSENHMDEVENKLKELKKYMKQGEETLNEYAESLLSEIGNQLEHVRSFLTPTWIVPT